MVELKPGIGTVDEIVGKCQDTGTKLVFDPRHFCRAARDGKEEKVNKGKASPFGSHPGWQLKNLKALAPHIEVIHFQPIGGEALSDLLAGTGNGITRTLVRECLELANIKIMIAEYRPPLNPLAVADTAQQMLEAVRKLTE